MTDMHHLGIDFAALRVLCLVHTEKSFSAAATALEVNQSTVSYTIDRLRKTFDDPLFVRQGGKTEPTPRCDELVVEVRLILEQFDRMVKTKEFDPTTSDATLRISSNYYERVIILPRLIRAIRSKAPGIHIQMISAQERGEAQLQEGQTDVLLSPDDLNLNGVYAKRLVNDRYVCLMDPSNPLAQVEMTEEIFRSANHAYVSYAQFWRSSYATDIRRKGLSINRTLSVFSPENMSDLLLGTDLISVVPQRIAHKSQDVLTYRDCPVPVPFQISMYWTTRTHRSKMHEWLRDLIVEITREIAKI